MNERSGVRVPAGAAGEFSSPGSNFCADFYFGIRSTFVSLQWHVKYLSHFAKRAGARLQLKLSYAACTLRMWLNLHEVTRHGAWMYAVQRVRASVRSQVCAC